MMNLIHWRLLLAVVDAGNITHVSETISKGEHHESQDHQS